MKIKNVSREKHYSLRCGHETLLIRAGSEVEVPERFMKDPAFQTALGSALIQVVVPAAEPVAEQPVQEEVEERPIDEEPKKTRKKQEVMPDA